MKLIQILTFASFIAFASCQMYYHSAFFNFNPSFVANASFVVYNDSEGTSRSNMTAIFLKEVKNMFWTYTVNLRTNGREYDRLLHSASFDVCNVEKGVLGNMIVKYVKEAMDPEYCNYKFQCPQPPALVYFKNFPIIDIKKLPRFFIRAREDFEFSVNMKAKVNGSKKMIYGMSLKTYGSAVF